MISIVAKLFAIVSDNFWYKCPMFGCSPGNEYFRHTTIPYLIKFDYNL